MLISTYSCTIELLVRKLFQIKRYTMMYVLSSRISFCQLRNRPVDQQVLYNVLYLLLKYPAWICTCKPSKICQFKV